MGEMGKVENFVRFCEIGCWDVDENGVLFFYVAMSHSKVVSSWWRRWICSNIACGGSISPFFIFIFFRFSIVYSTMGGGSIFFLSWTGEYVFGIAEGYLHIYQFSLENISSTCHMLRSFITRSCETQT